MQLFASLRVLLIALVALATACRSIDRSCASCPAQMLAVVHAQEEAWNAGDIEGFMERGYWRSEELSFYSGGTKTFGYESVLARYKSRYQGEGNEMGRLSFSELDARCVDVDAGMVRGRWQLEKSDGERPWGLFTLVMRRLPEGWRVVHDHTSLGSE
jgi:beta-aspartyl-peptidase (threonine type)